jgi:TolB protein
MSRNVSSSILSVALAASALAGIAACDTEGPVQLVSPGGTIASTAPSAIKNKPTFYFNGILFVSNYQVASGEVYSMNPDGSGVTRLTFADDTADASPDVNPAGPSFVWVRRPAGGILGEIYSQNLDGTKRKQLTSLGTTVGYPRYSPDGKKIAFAAWMPNIGPEIHVMNADGSGITRLTWTAGKSSYPSWSPDGSRIAFQSNDASGATSIWVMNADGSNQQQILACGWPGCHRPKFSPVANEIVVEHIDFSPLTIIDGTTGGQLGYIPQPNHDMYPTWSKDGMKIIFASQRSQNGGLDLFSTVPVRASMTAPLPSPPPVDRLTSFIGNELSAAYSR